MSRSARNFSRSSARGCGAEQGRALTCSGTPPPSPPSRRCSAICSGADPEVRGWQDSCKRQLQQQAQPQLGANRISSQASVNHDTLTIALS
eukprot:2347281-Rhodomonas_salina.1